MRSRSGEEAAYEFIVFCDDDHWLGPDCVRLVYALMMATGVGPQPDARGDAADAQGSSDIVATSCCSTHVWSSG